MNDKIMKTITRKMSQNNIGRSRAAAVTALLFTFLAPSFSYAHTGIGGEAGFASGIAHPLGGLDHLLTMVAVGIWAFQTGGKAIWAAPITFVGVMVFGCLLGITGVTVPFIEEGIIISVLMSGVLIAVARRMPLTISMAIVGLFAIFHGHAHGSTAPLAASWAAYLVGLATATASLHLCGIGMGLLFQRISGARLIRYAGATIAMGGVFFFLV